MAFPQLIARAVAGITARAVGGKHPDLFGLMQAWPEVVGPEWAARATPVAWQQQRRGAGQAQVVLELAVPEGEGLLVQHEIPVLLGRINGYFGHRAVSAIRMRTIEEVPVAPFRVRAEPSPLPVEGIDNPELAAALGRLGAAIREAAPRK